MPHVSSLYELIKKSSREKSRPLEIVCDWDEVIQPFQPLCIYTIAELEGISFKDFFKRFWEIADGGKEIRFTSDWRIRGVNGSEEEKKFFEKYLRIMYDDKILKSFQQSKSNEKIEERWKSFYVSPEWVEIITNAPFLNIAEDLLKALKEGLISKLVIISSYRKGRGKGQGVTRKKKVFAKTWSKFPQCELELTEGSSDNWGRVSPLRWEVLRNKYPDFDIAIDDNPQIIKEYVDNLPKDKIYAINDYACNKIVNEDNVYHIPTTVSDITEKDFVYQEQKTKYNSSAQKSDYIIWIVGGIILLLITIGGLILWLTKKEKKT